MLPLSGRNAQGCLGYRLRAGQHVAGHGGHRSRNLLVGIANVHVVVHIVVDVVVHDGRVVVGDVGGVVVDDRRAVNIGVVVGHVVVVRDLRDVGDAGIGNVDLLEVAAAATVGRQVRLAITQREPAHRGC